MADQRLAAHLDIFLEFVRLLRRAGIRIGLTETQDALSALASLQDLRSARTVLRAILAKCRADQVVFARVFDLFFGFVPEALALRLYHDQPDGISDVLESANVPHSGFVSGGAVSYAQALDRAVQLILKHAYITNDHHSATRTQEAILLLSRMIQQRAETQKSLEEIRHDLERAFLETAGKTEALEAIVSPVSVDNVAFSGLDDTQAELIEREIERLVAELTSRPKRRYRRERRGRPDLRRTFRRSLQYGGTPMRLAHRKRRLVEPKLFILVDVSSSVHAFAQFFLLLTRGFHATVGICRSFVFVDRVEEITERLEEALGRSTRPAEAVERVLQRLRLEGWGIHHTDYGTIFRQFSEEFGHEIDRRTMLVILGDARSNYTKPQADCFRRLHEQSERLLWLNPEPKARWDSGDSIISAYAPYCHQVLECRNLAQLREIVSQLTRGEPVSCRSVWPYAPTTAPVARREPA